MTQWRWQHLWSSTAASTQTCRIACISRGCDWAALSEKERFRKWIKFDGAIVPLYGNLWVSPVVFRVPSVLFGRAGEQFVGVLFLIHETVFHSPLAVGLRGSRRCDAAHWRGVDRGSSACRRSVEKFNIIPDYSTQNDFMATCSGQWTNESLY